MQARVEIYRGSRRQCSHRVDATAAKFGHQEPDIHLAHGVELRRVQVDQAGKPALVGGLSRLEGTGRPIAERTVVTVCAEDRGLDGSRRKFLGYPGVDECIEGSSIWRRARGSI